MKTLTMKTIIAIVLLFSFAESQDIRLRDSSGVIVTVPAGYKFNLNQVGGSQGVSQAELGDTANAIRGDFPVAGGGDFIASAGQVYLSVTKTNIGNAYADVYASAFDIENFLKVDLTGADSVRLIYIWDYVGTGTQQVRVADVSNNANVLVESATFTADQDPGDSGWKMIPVAFKAVKNLEFQGKSTTAGDDPVCKGYIIFVK